MIESSIWYFLATVTVTLAITYWAARQNVGRADYYAASAKITGTQNGLAIAGDFLSAGTILGMVALYFVAGVDTALWFLSPMVGLCLLLVFIVGPLRRLGRFTLGDVIGARLPDPRMRVVIGACTVTTSLINLVAQLVGAGALISVVFGLTFNSAVIIVGTLMTTYVVFGGMLAATWVQIIKAVLLVSAIATLSALAVGEAGGLAGLYQRADSLHTSQDPPFAFGALDVDLYSSISIAMGLTFGMMGMPHVLIRFFTVPDAHTARRSLVLATVLIGFALGIVFFVVGPAGLAFLSAAPAYREASGEFIGGPNMVTLHLARELGGNILFGVMSAVAFSTILAVVAGLMIAISSATSHDLAAGLRRGTGMSEKMELTLFRMAAVLVSTIAVGLAILFQHENIAFLIVAGYAVAASTTFPLLVLAIYWPKLTAPGAIAAGITGLVSSVGLIALSPVFWVKVLGFAEPIFYSDYPALISVPLAFVTAWAVSTLSPSTQASAS